MAISLGNKAGGASRGRMPSKRSINFAEAGKQRSHYWSALPVVAVLLVVAALVAKFGVMDRLKVVSDEEAKTAELQAQLEQANARVESFGALQDQYAQLTYSGMTEAEVTMADRVEVLDLIDTHLMGKCTVESWELSGNDLVVNVLTEGNEFRHISMLNDNITADPRVAISSVSAGQSYIVTSPEEGVEPKNMTTGKIKIKLVKKEVNKG
jgi:hypothetical protein